MPCPPAWAEFHNHSKRREEQEVVSLGCQLLWDPFPAMLPSPCIYFPKEGRRWDGGVGLQWLGDPRQVSLFQEAPSRPDLLSSFTLPESLLS